MSNIIAAPTQPQYTLEGEKFVKRWRQDWFDRVTEGGHLIGGLMPLDEAFPNGWGFSCSFSILGPSWGGHSGRCVYVFKTREYYGDEVALPLLQNVVDSWAPVVDDHIKAGVCHSIRGKEFYLVRIDAGDVPWEK